MRRAQPEQILQRAVIEHLAIRGVPGVFAFHVPNGGYRRPVEGRILKSLGTRPGIPDLLIVHAGRLYCLELKAPGGRASPAQLKTVSDLEYCGAKCAIAVGIDGRSGSWRIGACCANHNQLK
jgi:hypothetical protein